MSTVGKALELLELFRRDRSKIGLSEIARLSSMNKATCFRLMTELQKYGFVEQLHSSREYSLGPAILRLAALREETVPFRSVVQPALEALAERTGETAHVSMVVGSRLEMVQYAYSNRHATRVMMDNSDHLAFHATASGLSILAHSEPDFVEQVLSQPLDRFTGKTETDPARIRAQLEKFRGKGFAENAESFEAGVSSVAAPLFGARGECVGAVSVAAVSGRMNPTQRKHAGAEVVASARSITRTWGGVLPSSALHS